ncbi:MAG TPA: carboxypeptidase-like regulatory domain-containing protein [Candidatus Thermoplasmatota archaeon]|nr:carboxypeptidase-like regulatory domain-containing protein [Candidatus Thermoplasmatota archaeon]
MVQGTRAFLLVGAMLFLGLSGCAGPRAQDSRQPASEVVIDAQGRAIALEPVSNRTVDTGHGKVAENRALLEGRVHDAGNLTVGGARVAVLGTALEGRAGKDGAFRFENVPVGTFQVRVEASGFLAREVPVTTRAGERAFLDIALEPALGAGRSPHVHDFWGKATTRVLMDDVVPVVEQALPQRVGNTAVNGNPSNRQELGTPWTFYLPDAPDGLAPIVWPGTAEVRFTLSWSTAPQDDLPGVGAKVSTAASTALHDLGVAQNGASVSYMVGGDNETDNGHQTYSQWGFQLYIDNHATTSPTTWQPAVGRDGIHVKIELRKGLVGLEPGHQDFWNGSLQQTLGDPGYAYVPFRAYVESSEDAFAAFRIQPRDGKVNIVPPGTRLLRMNVSWSLTNGDAALLSHALGYHFSYRTADMNPRDTPVSAYKEPKLVASGPTSRHYEIEVKPTEVDGFYQSLSAWSFKWNEDGGRPYEATAWQVQFRILFTAVKDPAA